MIDETDLARRARQIAEEGAKQETTKRPTLWDRVWKQLKDMSLYDAIHPQGTGSTSRGYNDIYPPPGR